MGGLEPFFVAGCPMESARYIIQRWILAMLAACEENGYEALRAAAAHQRVLFSKAGSAPDSEPKDLRVS
jgi:hypothetical protein